MFESQHKLQWHTCYAAAERSWLLHQKLPMNNASVYLDTIA